MVAYGHAHRRHVGRDQAFLVRVSVPAHLHQHPAQLGQRARPAPVPLHQVARMGKDRLAPACWTAPARMASPDAVTVAGSRTPTSETSGDRRGRPLLDDVVDVLPVQHRQMGVLPGLQDQSAQDGLGDPAQRNLPLIGRADLVRHHADPVAPLLGQIHRQPLLDQHPEQPVRGGTRQAQAWR